MPHITDVPYRILMEMFSHLNKYGSTNCLGENCCRALGYESKEQMLVEQMLTPGNTPDEKSDDSFWATNGGPSINKSSNFISGVKAFCLGPWIGLVLGGWLLWCVLLFMGLWLGSVVRRMLPVLVSASQKLKVDQSMLREVRFRSIDSVIDSPEAENENLGGTDDCC